MTPKEQSDVTKTAVLLVLRIDVNGGKHYQTFSDKLQNTVHIFSTVCSTKFIRVCTTYTLLENLADEIIA